MTKISFSGECMTDVSLYIDVVGAGIVPKGWYVRDKIKKQRLYYIRSGKGSMRDAVGNRIFFEAGKIYIHPYNLVAEYESDPDDPIDHIYFDFISAPPIISDKPIVYDVTNGSPLEYTLKTVEALLTKLDNRRRIINGATHYNITESDTEYIQIFKNTLSLLLSELTLIKPLPYSSDTIVCDTVEYIRQHYSEPLTVAGLAERVGFEMNYFIRRFKRGMGMTPYAYLRSFRLLRAKELYSEGRTLSEVAELVGYENASSLSRSLRE